MTTCKTVQDWILSRDVNEFSVDTLRQIEQHVACCPDCERQLRINQRLQQMLRRFPVREVPENFEERVFAGVRAASRRDRSRTRAIWALAASVLLAVAVEVGTRQSVPGTDPLAGKVTLAVDTVTTVNLAFNAGHAMKDVRFVLSLPAGFEVDGHAGERRIEWTGELQLGKNLLGVPIRATPHASGILVAKVASSGLEKTFNVLLKADEMPPPESKT